MSLRWWSAVFSAAQPGDLAEEGSRHRDLALRVGVAAQSVAHESDRHGQMVNRSLDELDDMRQPEGMVGWT